MSKAVLLVLATLTVALVAAVAAGAASAGEVTGNCNNAPNEQAADNCTTQKVNPNASVCAFSGQNDDPDSTDPHNPPGRTQSYGQDVKAGRAEPSTDKEPFHPGFACNPNNPFPPEG